MKSLLFTYAMTYGGAVISLVNPWYGFLVYVAFGIIKPDSLWWWSVPQGNYSRIVAIAFLVGWIIHGCGNWRFGRGTLPLICLVAYWLILVIGASVASNFDLAWKSVEPMSKVFLPIIAGATLIDSMAKLKQLAWVIVICQGYIAYEFNLVYFFSPRFIPWEWYHSGLDNNGIAITMVTAIGMAFFLGVHAPRIWQRMIALALSGLMTHVILFSNSRGGMLSLLVTGAFVFLLLPKRPLYILILALGVAVALATTGENVQERFLSSFTSEEEGGDMGGGRLDFWKGCLQSMQDHPLGVGPNHWPVVAPQYGLPSRPAHSTWLEIGAELGLPGLACLLGFYLITMARLYPFLKERFPVADPWQRYFARMVISSILGFLAAAQFVTLYGVELPYFITLLGIGVLKVHSIQIAEGSALHAATANP